MKKTALRVAIASAAIAPILILGSGIASAGPPTAAPGAAPWSGEVWLTGTSAGEVWACSGFSPGFPPVDSTDVVGTTSATLTFAPNSPVMGICTGAQGPFLAPFVTTSAP